MPKGGNKGIGGGGNRPAAGALIVAGTSAASQPRFDQVDGQTFRDTFLAAKQSVASIKPKDAWRVDSTSYSVDDYSDMECYVTPGGSSVAIHNGDIISVCKAHTDPAHGSDLLDYAVKHGGTKLDAYSGLYGFYTKNGFEPVSWTRFDTDYAPPDWVEGRDGYEPVIFFKYTGASHASITRRYGSNTIQFFAHTPESKDYSAAQAVRDAAL